MKGLDSEEKVRQQTVEKKWTTPAKNDLPGQPRTLLQSMRERKHTFVFGSLVAFSFLYFYRPEDFVPGLDRIPMAKIAGIAGFLALAVGVLSTGKFKLPRALKILVLLLGQLILAIPFAVWRGGAFETVFTRFSKGLIAALLIGLAVSTLGQIRKLLWIQVSAVALVTFLSIALNHSRDGRLEGIQNSILNNPNDLAINIAIAFPLGVAFILTARGFKKAVWALALTFMCLGVVLTLSRSGLIAFVISTIICVWEYGVKGKRRSVVICVAATLLVGLGITISNSGYRARVESILLGNIEGSHDKGSREARKILLKKSVMVALTHPLLGVGPGCFMVLDGSYWAVAHNSYTEIAAEAGFPALILFLLAIWAAFKNLSEVRKSRHYREVPEFKLFTQALRAGLAAYMAGALFASIEYLLYSYLMVAYTCAMLQIASRPIGDEVGKTQRLGKGFYDSIPRPQPILSR